MRIIGLILLLVPACSPVQEQTQAFAAESSAQGNPCLTQDGEAVTARLKAIGTEPVWAAETEGRCVTYKTPEDPVGTRVWTTVMKGPEKMVWKGTLRGEQFELTVTPRTDCSDGMSDRVYLMEAVLRVDGETRRGCAESR